MFSTLRSLHPPERQWGWCFLPLGGGGGDGGSSCGGGDEGDIDYGGGGGGGGDDAFTSISKKEVGNYFLPVFNWIQTPFNVLYACNSVDITLEGIDCPVRRTIREFLRKSRKV